MRKKILVVDDEESIHLSFSVFLSEEGYEVGTASSIEDAVELLNSCIYDLLIADTGTGVETGGNLLKTAKFLQPATPVVMITDDSEIEAAAEAFRNGAFDYIIKPINLDTLLRVTKKALKHRAIEHEKERRRLNYEAVFKSVKAGIITVDRSMMITDINDAAGRLLDIRRDNAVGRHVSRLASHCGGRFVHIVKEILEQKQELNDRFIECHCMRNPRQVISLAASPLFGANGELSGSVLLVRDESSHHELKSSRKDCHDLERIVGKSEAIRQVKALVRELADVQSTVLITGESGTGKGLVAEALYRLSSQFDRPLVKVNCAALSETLLESELFGHVRGAFTGAVADRIGRFELADGGTIFLDEIGEISPRMQLRLLRVIESGEFERVGDSKTVQMNMRVVAATNQELTQKVEAGAFRKDLYYRLKVVEIKLPSLRERLNDLPLLIDHFLYKFNRLFSSKITGLSTSVLDVLRLHSWPGNIRELENTLEHAFVLCRKGIITMDHLPPGFRHIARKINSTLEIGDEKMEAACIRRALVHADWNKTKAAAILGVSRRTIYRKIEQHKIFPLN
ncbi:sigma-54 dependent transcriptional regulator [Desulfosediminicola sp.]|uniref:sigma-54 dependent transcriptional regulator n=1 Tax=Desulfosediminicola sp. TaxID=2886825 RepID=UPI003AF25B16